MLQRLGILLILLLAFPLVQAEPVCITGDGVAQDYTCWSQSAAVGASLDAWCISQGGRIGDSANSECTQTCCCMRNQNLAWNPGPISQQFCADNYPDEFRFAAESPDCDAQCGDTPTGGTGGTFTVTGTIFDQSTAPAGVVDAARIEYPVGNTIATAFSDVQGKYTLNNVPSGGTLNFRASRIDCGAQQQLIDATNPPPILTLDFTLDCSAGLCVVEAVNDTTARPLPGTGTVEVMWSSNTCANTQGYKIYRCTAADGTCTGAGEAIGYVAHGGAASQAFFLDQQAPPGAELCYFARALTPNGGEVDQAITDNSHCVRAMHPFCMENSRAGWQCFNNNPTLQPIDTTSGQPIIPFTGVARCDENNRIEVAQNGNCGAQNQYCYYTSVGTPSCGNPEDCDQCNGLFGWFVDLSAQLLNSFGAPIGQSCRELSGCVLNNEGYASDTVQDCGSVTSCYDYRTQTSCEGNSGDPCRVSSSGCTWSVEPTLEELGGGICTPNSESSAACGECAAVYGYCDAALCSTLGECYYNTVPQVPQHGEVLGCVAKEQMACRFYDTREDCIDRRISRPVVATQYDFPDTLTGARVGGTNEITVPSNDPFDFGTCAWVELDPAVFGPDKGYCVKDANHKLAPIPWLGDAIEDDCIEVQNRPFSLGIEQCFKDTEPPTTILPFQDGNFIDAEQLRNTLPVVTDNTFPESEIITWGGLVPQGSPCYPNQPYDSVFPSDIGAAPYTLCYYSEDWAGNLEVVQRVDLIISSDSGAHLIDARLLSG